MKDEYGDMLEKENYYLLFSSDIYCQLFVYEKQITLLYISARPFPESECNSRDFICIDTLIKLQKEWSKSSPFTVTASLLVVASSNYN